MSTKVFLDTNVFIATCLSPAKTTSTALLLALNGPYEVFTSYGVIDEYQKKTKQAKFRKKERVLIDFLDNIRPLLNIVKTPKDPVPEELFIADKDDRPILRAALAIGADVFVSGDNHFLDARPHINSIEIILPCEFFRRVMHDYGIKTFDSSCSFVNLLLFCGGNPETKEKGN